MAPTTAVSVSLIGDFKSKEHNTGASVTAINSAPSKANPYVTDMGAKIFPGTPVIVKSGTKATTMTAVEKTMGLPT